jgi:biopolymer transport protein ExbD
MRYALCAFVCFTCGCGQKPAPSKPTSEPYLPAEIRLPDASCTELSEEPSDAVYLNVTEEGKVLLAPGDQPTDATGHRIDTLDTAEQVRIFLSRRAKEYYAKAENKDRPLRTVVVMRVDARTPFEKTGRIVLAARHVGYVHFQWRALRPAGEGRIEIRFPPDRRHLNDERGRFFVRVTTQANKIAKITLHQDEDEVADAGADLGADPESLFKRLSELNENARKKNEDVELFLQIDGQLLQTDVIRLLDAAIRGGFYDVVPVLLDPKNR